MRLNWGHGVAAVYTTFATATLWFVVFAIGHPAELVSADYYERAVEHDSHAAAVGRTAALAEAVTARVDADGRVTIAVPRQSPADAITGRAMLYRASSAGDDKSYPLALDPNGQQTLPTTGLPSGHWTLKLQWQTGGHDYYAERPVILP